MRTEISFKNNKNQILRGFVYTPKKYDTAIIFLHGFPSSCRGFTSTRLSQVIEKTNYLLMLFDFSGTDLSDGKFEDKLISQEVKDIKYAIDFLEKNYSYKKLILVGHSTGAIDAALYAYKDIRIDKLILIAGSGDLKRAVQYEFTPLQVRDFWTKRYMIYKDDKQWLNGKKLKKAYYDEFFKLDPLKALAKWKKPVLIIHGEKDEAIPVHKDPQELFAAANKPKKLAIIKGADHRFSQKKHFIKLLMVVHQFIKN